MEIPTADDDVDGVDEQHVVETHLENLWKQRAAWKLHYRNSITWAFLKVNDNQPINLFKNQIMRCIICHNEITLPKILAMCTRCRKGPIAYHKFNGIIAMKKHVESNHSTLLQKMLENPTNLTTRFPLACEPSKKKAHVSPYVISGFFSSTYKFKKDDAIQIIFLEYLMLFVIKGLIPMRTIKSIWLQRLVYRLCPRLLFPPRKSFVEETLSSLIENTMTTYVQSALVDYILTTYTFDLWMSKGTRDVFVVVVNFISSD
jgi:hypothetical protein